MDRQLYIHISHELKSKQKLLIELDDQIDAKIKNNSSRRVPRIGVEKEKLKSQGLLSIIEKSWKVAEELTENVLILQTRQEELTDCLHLLQSVKDIKSLVTDLQKIIISNSQMTLPILEHACEILKRYVDIDCIENVREIYLRIGGSTSAQASPSIMADSLLSHCPVTEMEGLLVTITESLMSAFDNAVAGKNPQEITAVFKLFPLIGKRDLGLDKLSAYVCGIVSENVNVALKKASESKNPGMYLDCLVLLFEAVASMIDRQQGIVEYYYGVGSMLIIIQRLQREADVQSGLLLNSLSDARQLERKGKEIKQLFDLKMKTKSSAVIFENDSIDSRDIDFILNELSTLCNKSQLFDRFIRSRAQDEIEKIKIFNDQKKQEAIASARRVSVVRSMSIANDRDYKQAIPVPNSIGIPPVTKLATRVHEFTNNFVLLASFYMEKSIAKAIKLDTLDADMLTSSMVDDVFFVFKSTLMRGVDAGEAGCLCGLVNSVSRILEEEFMTLLLSRLSGAFSGNSGGGISSSDVERLGVIAPLVNNIDQSCHFINQLCEQIEQDVKKVFSNSPDLEREQIVSCLEGLTEYSSKTRLILRRWIDNYFTQAVKPKIRSILAGVTMESKYVLSEEEYNIYSLHQADILPQKFMHQYERIVKTHQEKLTPSNMTLFAGLVLTTMLKEWETRIFASKINLYGALRLDGEVRGCVARFSASFTASPVSSQTPAILSLGVIRDLFARLSQVCLVLGLETPGEISEIWGKSAGSIRWRLSAAEIRKILACRIELEFSNTIINSLSL